MLSTLLRSPLGRPALASLRGRTVSMSSAISSSSSSFSRAYPILLGRGLVSTNSAASFVLGARPITTTTLGEPTAAKATKKATTTKKTSTTKKATKSPVKKKGAAAKKKAVAKKKPRTLAAKKVKSAKPKTVKKKIEPKVPKIYKKDLKPPFRQPKSAWAAFASKRFSEINLDGPKKLKEYLPVFAEEWHQMDKDTQDTYKASGAEYEEYRKRKEEWRKNLEPRLKRALKKMKKRGPYAMPAPPFAEFVKERFASTEYPEGVVKATEKMKFLGEAYRTQIDPTEKEALKQRALDSFERKKTEAAEANSRTTAGVI
ncbi:hypothetical protein CPB83DRAFT_856589 [Crepidotus variabilis]|uniref:Uncharacterized protein n=1 Tax=Crepidotus variabilis TaxID=179855 RepID=A0A9P6EDS7_9AGAR|nr:hypothetical protein CPB83DRAFT_856589 [Crepidotus variabilis]